MALILVFVNESDLAPVSDYRVQVLVGNGTVEGSRVIHTGTHKGHRRDDGWEKLVRDYMSSLQGKGQK